MDAIRTAKLVITTAMGGEVSVLRHRSQRHSLAEDRALMPTAQQLALQVLRPFIAETLDTDPISIGIMTVSVVNSSSDKNLSKEMKS